MKRRIASYFGVAACAVALFSVKLSSAQECMLGPVALPMLSGPPEWEDFDGNAFWRPELHDPRWSGAPLDFLKFVPSIPNPVGAGASLVRAVASGKVVYLSFQVQVDDNGPNGDDYVYVGLSEGSANGAYVLKAPLTPGGASIGAPVDPDGGGPVTVQADSPLPSQVQGLSWWHTNDATATIPTWGLEQVSALSWVKSARFDRPGVGSPRWAVTLKLDLSPSGLGISGNTRWFFGTSVNLTTGDVILGNATPKTSTDADRVGDTIVPRNSSQWVPYLEPGVACTAGITLSSGDIGVWSGAAGSYAPGAMSNTICAGGACGSGNNVFRVTARSVPNPVGAWSVRSRIRIADWGSTVALWNYGRWKDISAIPSGTAVFTGPAGDLSVTNGWHWLPPVDAGDGTSAITIDYQCNKGADAYCPKLVDESYPHQCMLVELGQPAVYSYKFRNTAAYRNMDYADLSTNKTPATISLEGLKDALGESKDRDVYLYVEGRNMPKHGRKAIRLPKKDMLRARQIASAPLRVPTLPGRPVVDGQPTPNNVDARDKGKNVPGLRAPGKLTDKEAAAHAASDAAAAKRALAELARVIESPEKFSNGVPLYQTLAMEGEQLLDTVWPTYRVHVFYDSGKTFSANGKTNKVLVPMVPFGFRFDHDGALYGFSDALNGIAGATVKDLGKNWYKLSMASESSAKVQTTVTAEEEPLTKRDVPKPRKPKTPPGSKVEYQSTCHCRTVGESLPLNNWGILAFGALGLALFMRRRL